MAEKVQKLSRPKRKFKNCPGCGRFMSKLVGRNKTFRMTKDNFNAWRCYYCNPEEVIRL